MFSDMTDDERRGPGRPKTGRRWYFREAKLLYLSRLETLGKKPGSLKAMRWRIERVERFFGWERDLRSWTPADEPAFIEARRAQGVCNNTINQEIVALKAMVSRSIKEEKLLPTKALLSIGSEPLPVEENAAQSLSEKELEVLRKAARESKRGRRTELVIWIIEDSGLRHREACHLHRQNLELDRNFIVLYSKSTKSRKERRIPISPELSAELQNYLKEIPDDQQYLFPGFGFNQPIDNIFRDVKAAYKHAGIKIRRPGLHAIRKTWATKAVREGVDIDMLRDMAGWEDMNTAKKYFSSSDDKKQAAMAKVYAKRDQLKSEPAPAATSEQTLDLIERLMEEEGWSYKKAREFVTRKSGA